MNHSIILLFYGIDMYKVRIASDKMTQSMRNFEKIKTFRKTIIDWNSPLYSVYLKNLVRFHLQRIQIRIECTASVSSPGISSSSECHSFRILQNKTYENMCFHLWVPHDFVPLKFITWIQNYMSSIKQYYNIHTKPYIASTESIQMNHMTKCRNWADGSICLIKICVYNSGFISFEMVMPTITCVCVCVLFYNVSIKFKKF